MFRILVLGFLFWGSAWADLSANDLRLVREHAVQDVRLLMQNGGSRVMHAQNNCDDGVSGSQRCWDACLKEGYTSATCAGRCGIVSENASLKCWSACAEEGYTSSLCAGRCGIVSPGAQNACWDMCLKEGYPSAICAGRCGTN
ncbi:MAG TPA: hypothetical protein PKC28_01755 [Bdellovibrionales bacterium]|nr:hypothetical protein [Bdellovibrionales bacterium]